MDPVNYTPGNANYTNADGTEGYAPPPGCPPQPTCGESLDQLMYETGDAADSMRDWKDGKASGRDVWDAVKDWAKEAKDTIENCTDDPKDGNLIPVFPTPVYY